MLRYLRLAVFFSLVFVTPRYAVAQVAGGADDSRAERRTAMIGRIDELIAKRWAEEGIEPAGQSGDAEFLRRVYLDLTGVIPPVARVRAFLSDERPDKRARVIGELLLSPGYATHLATTWRNIMLPRGFDAEQLASVAGVQNWLRDEFVANKRYDNMVADLLVATGGNETGPALFYTSLNLKPEELAAQTSRIFLGVQLQCAQCHDHPFDSWTQDDFWGYAAFFARLRQSSPNQGQMPTRLIDAPTGEVTLPETDSIVPPKYLGGVDADPDEGGTRRRQLAIWTVSRDNPYLARAAVNWTWSHLFGRGLVEPVDDMSEKNPPSHPELLDELSAYFVEIGYDMRELLRTLANTGAYQLSSYMESDTDVPPELFSRMTAKPLTAEQLYDSMARTLRPQEASMNTGRPRADNRLYDARRQAFLAKMATRSRNSSEYEAGLPQALMLMNGPIIAEATDGNKSGLLTSLEAPLFTDHERVEMLFLATLSRPPNEQEQARFVEHVTDGGSTGDRRKALSDVLWALLNSAEFAFNH